MKGAIFDFDGVIFHSVFLHEACWEAIAKEEKKPFSKNLFLQDFGVKNERFISEVLGWTSNEEEIAQIIKRKEEKFHTMLQERGIDPIAGTIELLEKLAEMNIPCAIASSAVLEHIDLVLSFHPEIRQFFTAIVSSEEVALGKPNPEVFLKAASKLKIEPKDCVVFEDAPAGIQAALSAGMKAVALTTTFPENILRSSNPTKIVSSLDCDEVLCIICSSSC